jgi:hypothetical protein
MRIPLLAAVLFLSPSALWADAPTPTPAQGVPTAKRLTGDGVELPETASYRWYGKGVSLPEWGDPLGKTPEEVFGSAAAVRTLEKSGELAQSLISPADTRTLTLPYFVTGQWGADYVGFSLFEGRIYRLEVRFRAPTQAEFAAVTSAFQTAKLGPDSQLATRGYAAEVTEKWTAGRPAVFRLDPTWKYIFPQDFTFTPGMTVTQVMDGTQCNRKWPGSDERGDYFILDQPNPTDRADDPATPHVQKYKVYVEDDKAVALHRLQGGE